MARSDWTIQERGEGFVLFWRGREWPSDPFISKEEAEEYLSRLCSRYPGNFPGILLGDEEEDTKRTKGGPWRFSYPTDEGEERGVIHTSRKKDAKSVLRRRLDRQRLPNGTTWEIAQDLPKP